MRLILASMLCVIMCMPAMADKSKDSFVLNISMQMPDVSAGGSQCTKTYSVSKSGLVVASVSCGLGRTCNDGERCCIMGAGYWCCPSSKSCDYDNITCK